MAAVPSSSAPGSLPAYTSHAPAPTPLLAQGDWTKNLIHLAKTAELKKHALTLQLHTAHIMSAHATLDQKNKAIQDLKEQKAKLETERARLLTALREVNEDRDKTDMLEAKLNDEVSDIQGKIRNLSEGDYATAKADVDRLRQELGQPPLPSLQTTIEEKSAQYLKELRLQAEAAASATTTPQKRASTEGDAGAEGQPAKRPRGRPKGSKNSTKKGKPISQTQDAPGQGQGQGASGL